MTIIVEDGSIVAGANSYASLSDAQALVTALGYTATLTEANILRSMSILNTLDYYGTRVESTQPLPFPRSGVYLSDYRVLAQDAIPPELIIAESVLAAEISLGNDPSAVRTAGIIREKVDVIEIEYQSGSVTRGASIFDIPLVSQNLRYLVCGTGGTIGRA